MLDERQIKRAIAGDRKAFAAIMQTQASYLVKMAQLYVARDADVQEVISETTLTAFTSIHTLKKPAYFRTWLTKILIRTCYQRYAQHQHEAPDVPLPDVPSGDSELRAEMRMDILNGIRQLNERYQQTLLMYYYNGLSIHEIHLLTSLSENTIKTHLRRGKAQLKEWLGGDYYEN
ncbi:hypothetical protein IV56_GL002165 [Lacticaseibacillus saniviri JCM 17471 = DSM 24301]|uniref:Uncharacterized protein n=1 Tax=Lacticaseibacillus saniviri JCM 17471 = DSM 24301 TaxID=1293598 RepID=A0A0R2MQ48_9LACO|nr:hypothetical protein IV56_GL002165 [Lacticaseibacillus saniviri JCM 17471 = DSM 24301]